MNRLKIATAASALALLVGSCASYNAYQKARSAETLSDWDQAVVEYQKALELSPDSIELRMKMMHAKLEASRVHFEKGKSLRTAASAATGAEQVRLAELAATELQITVKLDSTNQFAAVELGKVIQILQDAQHAADQNSLEERKKRAKNITKTAPPQLNPASDQPISLSFPRDTPVKDIYRALGNAFGINIMFDQAVKDDRISIELKDVTAQQALERVMQAAGHFYKPLDEHTIIIIPDNPQARRDYEDLVIRTFYLSNGDAEQVTNVVRTMIEARNVFPLKALNAITIRDTADKVRIAEKIIEANDKAKAEVVVDVELLQLDLNKARNIGMQLLGSNGSTWPGVTAGLVDKDGKAVGALNLDQIRGLSSNLEDRTVVDPTTGKPVQHHDASGNLVDLIFPGSAGILNFTVPSFAYNLMKSASNSELLANPELRISEGEKATLHIGSRIPVPVSTFNAITTGTQAGGTVAPVTSYQYQDVGIKVSIEPRVHHNREATLKLTVEVSNLAGNAPGSNPPQPIISTRTIESTIRLKDGETNFLAGLIQHTDNSDNTKIPILGDIPVLGRFFQNENKSHSSTDLVLTMTPHIIRIPDITDDDLAPMWVGTQNNLTFRGVSPRIESQAGTDPFTAPAPRGPNGRSVQLAPDGEAGNYVIPEQTAPATTGPQPAQGGAPTNIFSKPAPPQTQQEQEQGANKQQQRPVLLGTPKPATQSVDVANEEQSQPTVAQLRLAPRISPQPASLSIKPGQEVVWNVIGMDLDGLQANNITMHYDPMALSVDEVSVGPAVVIDPKTPPVVKIDKDKGIIILFSSTGKPLEFASGGEVAMLRVHGGLSGDTMLVLDDPSLHKPTGLAVESAITGGRAKIQ